MRSKVLRPAWWYIANRLGKSSALPAKRKSMSFIPAYSLFPLPQIRMRGYMGTTAIS